MWKKGMSGDETTWGKKQKEKEKASPRPFYWFCTIKKQVSIGVDAEINHTFVLRFTLSISFITSCKFKASPVLFSFYQTQQATNRSEDFSFYSKGLFFSSSHHKINGHMPRSSHFIFLPDGSLEVDTLRELYCAADVPFNLSSFFMSKVSLNLSLMRQHLNHWQCKSVSNNSSEYSTWNTWNLVLLSNHSLYKLMLLLL